MSNYQAPSYVAQLANVASETNMFTNGFALYEMDPSMFADIDLIAAIILRASRAEKAGRTERAADLMYEADRFGRILASRLQRKAGAAVSLSMMLALVRQLAELRVTAPDHLRAARDNAQTVSDIGRIPNCD